MTDNNQHKSGLILIGFISAGIISPLISRLLANSEGTLPWLIDLVANWQGFYAGKHTHPNRFHA